MAAESGQTLEIWPTGFSGAKRGSIIVTISAVVFYFASTLAIRLIPQTAKNQSWRWKNISVSLLHAAVSGVWALLCFVEEPKMNEDLIKTHTTSSHTLISVSTGYFLYDTFDMLMYQRNRKTFELLIHHFVILVCFGIAIVTKFYVGYATLALIVELNSIFLHTRQLLQCCGYNKSYSGYRLNSIINLMTFLGCRILTLAWMTRWIVINKDLVPLVFYSIGSIGLAIMTAMNIILFYRLLHSDFIRKKESCQKED